MNDMMEKLIGCLMMLLIWVGLAFIFALPVMWLWNGLMPDIFGLTKISWLQALGINVLSGILIKGDIKFTEKK